MENVIDTNPTAEAVRERPLAGVFRRVIAFLIDGIILWFGSGLVWMVLRSVGIRVWGRTEDILTFLIALIYFTYYDSEKKAGSLGKQTMGMQVVNERDELLTIEQSAKRTGLKLVFNLLPLLWIAPAITKYRQGLHDVVARTFVVDN